MPCNKKSFNFCFTYDFNLNLLIQGNSSQARNFGIWNIILAKYRILCGDTHDLLMIILYYIMIHLYIFNLTHHLLIYHHKLF